MSPEAVRAGDPAESPGPGGAVRTTDVDAERADDQDLIRSAERARAGHPLAWGLVIGAVTVLAVVLLVVQNSDDTDLRWLWFDATAPLWVLTVIAFLLGAACWAALRAGIRLAVERSRVRRDAVHHLRDAHG